MNVMEITDQDYTTTRNLYSLTIHISGESESRISPFSTGSVSIECNGVDCIFANTRDLHLENVQGGGQIIDLTTDVGIFADSMTDAINQIEQIQFIDIWGLGGILQLTPPTIRTHGAVEIPDYELASANTR